MIRLGEEELERAVIEIREKGAELAEAEAQYQYLESMHKITKATVFLETAGQGLTVRDRECMAESHKDVIKYVPLIKEEKKFWRKLFFWSEILFGSLEKGGARMNLGINRLSG